MTKRLYIFALFLACYQLISAQSTPSFLTSEIEEARIEQPDILTSTDSIYSNYNGLLYTYYNTSASEIRPTTQPSQAETYGIISGGEKTFNLISTEGYFLYSKSQQHDVDWQLRTPGRNRSALLLADSSGGDWKINTLHLHASATLTEGKIRPTISVLHAISQAGKDTDPRSLNNMVHIETGAGIKWLVSPNNYFGATLNYAYEKEDINVMHLGNMKESTFFSLLGQKSLKLVDILTRLDYRFIINNYGTEIAYHQQNKKNAFTISGKIDQQINRSVYEPYDYIVSAQNEVTSNSKSEVSEFYLFRELSINFISNTDNGNRHRFTGDLRWNNGRAYNELQHQTEVKLTMRHLKIAYDFLWTDNKNGINIELKQTNLATNTILYSDEKFNFNTLKIGGSYALPLNTKYTITVAPFLMGELHHNDRLTFTQASPFLEKEVLISEKISQPNFDYYSSDKYAASLQIKVDRIVKRKLFFLQILGSYSNICTYNLNRKDISISAGVQF